VTPYGGKVPRRFESVGCDAYIFLHALPRAFSCFGWICGPGQLSGRGDSRAAGKPARVASSGLGKAANERIMTPSG
jgi:hypothetical protein